MSQECLCSPFKQSKFNMKLNLINSLVRGSNEITNNSIKIESNLGNYGIKQKYKVFEKCPVSRPDIKVIWPQSGAPLKNLSLIILQIYLSYLQLLKTI